jgi:hypothetical protein
VGGVERRGVEGVERRATQSQRVVEGDGGKENGRKEVKKRKWKQARCEGEREAEEDRPAAGGAREESEGGRVSAVTALIQTYERGGRMSEYSKARRERREERGERREERGERREERGERREERGKRERERERTSRVHCA